MTNDHPLTQQEFDSIYAKVPRLTVEIIIKNDKGGVYLTKRNIEPCKGLWHLPGGTVRFGEPLTDAVKRIAKRELGIAVIKEKMIGYIEYPSHYLNDMDSPVGIAFEVTEFDGTFAINEEAGESGWFEKLPAPMHDEQVAFLHSHSK